MSKELKIVLGIIGVLLVLCCLAGGVFLLVAPRMAESFVDNAIVENPAEAAIVAQGIVDYTLPSGYAEQIAMNFAGIKMVMIAPQTASSGMLIMFMEYPEALGGSPDDMQRQIEDAMAQQSGYQSMNMTAAGTQEAVINGEKALLTVLEGSDENGNQLRQATGIFESKTGSPAMLMVMGDLASWDTEAYNTFIQSMQTGR